ncbi:WAT1-related protein At1g43650-like isoform X1 [Arachis stenosperma]|uniref:WAT1-related protein At1g43650-like isoform X1 n=1 Tax=Arachis stenosperma TaxID=217475 RepID=UPI0025AC9621|nr:WAT1-related protein At1g43650-like isoform X1 [Arachis stenosperma]
MGNKIIAPFVGMVMAMVLQSGSMVVIKAAMNDDFNKYVLIVYSLALSTLLLLPFLFLLPRSERPPLSFSTLCNLFLLSLCGLKFRTNICICGHRSQLTNSCLCHAQPHSSFNFCTCTFIQASVIKNYPTVMVTVFFQLLFSTIQCSIFALIAVRDQSAWQLKLDTGLIAIFYQAIAATTLRYLLCTWSVQKAGPFFCSMFKPILIIFTVIMGALFLGDDFYLGSLIGAVIIVVGFYGVMWGKATEEKCMIIDEERLQSTCQNAPLLHDKHVTI